MEFTKEKLIKIIKETLKNVNESDLIVKKGKKTWSEHKSELNKNIKSIIKDIEDDVYDKEEGIKVIVDNIDDTIEILKDWKKKIKSGAKKGSVLDEYED